MKLSNLVWCLFGAMALSACSNDDVNPGGSQGQEEGESRYLSVVISNPIGTRAEELEGNYESGSEKENTITSLRFYFFNSTGEATEVKQVENVANKRVNFLDATPERTTDSEMDNVELKYNAVVVLNTTDLQNKSVERMVAVANYEDANLGNESMSLAQLQEKVGKYNTTIKSGKGHFMMTSSSYADANGQINAAVVKPEHLRMSKKAAEENPVEIYIERVLAKTRLAANITPTAEGDVVENVTLGGSTVTAYKLKYSDDTYVTIKRDGETEAQQVYVVFNGWNVTGVPNMSYMFKKVNSTTAWGDNTTEFAWNANSFYRSYWAMNPTTDGTTPYALQYDNYKSINKTVGAGTDKATFAVAYHMENAADKFEDGTKSGYNPNVTRTNRTQAIVAAQLVTLSGTTATPFDLAKWGGLNYTREGVIAKMVATVGTQIYKKVGEEKKPIDASDVELVPAVKVGQADSIKENSPRYRNCLQLKEGSTTQFYSDSECTATMTSDQVNASLKVIPGASVWNGGKCYYYTDLKHISTATVPAAPEGQPESVVDTKGQYGVVRNHIYDVNVTSVVGLGTPVDNVDEIIYPQKPENDQTYIAARINILSWRVVDNNTSFTW